ncbi:MAG TPA: hypothetical protein VE398_18210, partial [Acidobacteriota bacterium]|nr:hypothetical protein [Acidobacteriota bacterium]
MSEEPGLDKGVGGTGAEGTPVANEDSNLQKRDGFLRRAWRRVAAAFKRITPGPRAWRGAAAGVFITAGLAYLTMAVWVTVLARKNLAIYIIVLALPPLFLLAGGLALFLVRVVNRLPSFYLWALLSSGMLLGLLCGGLGPLGILTCLFACVLIGSLMGASLRILAAGGWGGLTKAHRAITAGGLVAGLALAGFAAWW